MKQWKTYKPMHKLMRRKGFEPKEKMAVTKWKNSKVHIIHLLLPNSDFEKLGLYDLESVDVGLLSPRAIKVA
jgi:RNA-directed DNA polymerase